MRKEVQEALERAVAEFEKRRRPNKSDCVNAKGSKPTGLGYELLLCCPPSKRSRYY